MTAARVHRARPGTCPDCGSLVIDFAKHDAWHVSVQRPSASEGES